MIIPDRTKYWLDLMNNADPAKRREAAIALGSLGISSAIPALINLLFDNNAAVRSGASYAIIEIGLTKSEIPLLLSVLRGDNEDAQRLALHCLLAYRGVRTITRMAILPVIRMLGSANEEVRFLATQWLRKQNKGVFRGLGHNAATSQLPISEHDGSALFSAIVAILRLPRSPLIPLSDCLQHPLPQLRCAAILACGRDLFSWESYIIPLMRDPTEDVQCLAIEVLGEGKSLNAVDWLVDLVAPSNSIAVRYRAVLSLGKIGVSSHNVLSAVSDCINDSNAIVRRGALQSLRTLGLSAVSLLPRAFTLVTDSDPDVSLLSATLLRELAPRTPKTIIVLLDALPATIEPVSVLVKQLIAELLMSLLQIPLKEREIVCLAIAPKKWPQFECDVRSWLKTKGDEDI